jgi:membrane protease YdiL (CAAX protease family)
MPLMWFYLGMLGASLFLAFLVMTTVHAGNREQIEKQMMTLIVVVEVLDTILVLIAICVMTRPPPSPKIPTGQKVSWWALSLPVLGVLLGLNMLYHHILQRLLGIPPSSEQTMFGDNPWAPLVLLTVCVQPGIVEELFFRYLALGTLRRHMNVHLAVLVSSIMFGMAHIYAPLSIPLLIVVGMGLGYIRIWSGSLVLPMLMHCLHNFAVVVITIKQAT